MTSLRLLFFASTLALAGCGDASSGTPDNSGGSAPSAGGSTSVPPGGSGGSSSSVPLAGSGQAVGDGDQGQPFAPGEVVMIMPPDTSGGMMNGGSGGGSGIPGDGNEMTATLRRGFSGTAVFKQTGEDVTVKFDITGGCSDGEHAVAIHDGYACDSATTEGQPWGERGTGFGPITCSGGKGTLEYTRTGADKTKNWTVADHVQETDVTAHVLIIANADNPRAGCANFF